ncbi:hypothetical protein Baya_14197 [Bagarius yarrelli]|uniref:Uncharacterized protein n=1 Tax=Bagarius yarrelli TaxID=175774 RepID=A0A556V845_BAGYA|nr:hypothetical protein Baya_14197 [Bagarius yarrelli]
MENTPIADHNSTVKLEWSKDVRVRYMSAQLRRENTQLRERLGRLRILHSDLPEFRKEKREMIEAFYRSCARERELKERVHEEEMKNACIMDTLADLKCRKSARNSRRFTLNNLKRAVFVAKCSLEDVQYELMERDEIIRKRNAEIEELSVLDKNCYLHVKETGARLQGAEEAVHEWKLLRAQNKVKKEKMEKTPKIRQSRGTDMIIAACSFTLTLLFLLTVIFFVKPTSSREENRHNTCHVMMNTF